MPTVITLHNTASRQLEEFSPQPLGAVGMYHCGPTVYDRAHIGNLRAYVFADILRRTFETAGYGVTQVVNITDVGHLSSDADEGEDKMTKALKREGLPLSRENMLAIGTKYMHAFIEDMRLLGIKLPHHLPRASEHIPEQIALIEELVRKGFAYTISDGIYFDTAQFGHERYAAFARLDLAGMRAGARVETHPEKKHPFDFALWKFNAELGWESPWGRGFPGWHLECSAMSRKYLGQPFDIHTGGVDHIPIHHTNEIAQSEAAYGVPLARYWMHVAHMTVNGEKMSKSLGNTYTLSDLAARGISPMAFRYWLLTAHYRTTINFTWEAIEGAQRAYHALREKIYHRINKDGVAKGGSTDMPLAGIADDMNSAVLISEIWKMVEERHTQYTCEAVRDWIARADQVLGLQLLDYAPEEIVISPELRTLLDARSKARDAKDWAESDRLRDEIQKLGFVVRDTPRGQELERA